MTNREWHLMPYWSGIKNTQTGGERTAYVWSMNIYTLKIKVSRCWRSNSGTTQLSSGQRASQSWVKNRTQVTLIRILKLVYQNNPSDILKYPLVSKEKKNPKIKILTIPNITSPTFPLQTSIPACVKKHSFALVIVYSFYDAVPFQMHSLPEMSTAEVDKDITDHKSKDPRENTFSENRYIC